MNMLEMSERDLGSIRLPSWGRVVRAAGPVLRLVVDPSGQPVEPIRRFLADFLARGNAAGSVRSYCFVLCRWWRFLQAVDVRWDRATSAEVRDLVLWLLSATKPRAAARTVSKSTAGQLNPVTGKQYLGDGYAPRTIRHSNAVLRAFYDFWIEAGEGPLVNPVLRQRSPGPRRSWASAARIWTGAINSFGSSARAPAPRNGCRPVLRRSYGSACTSTTSVVSDPTSRCGGRCGVPVAGRKGRR